MKRIYILFPIALIFLIIFLVSQNVSTVVTIEDTRRILSLNLGSFQNIGQYRKEIFFIQKVQSKVLEIAPRDVGIAFGKTRELKDLLENKFGLCYDRSRSIEKILKYYNFEVRHLSIHTILKDSILGTLITRQGPSHAVTEVKTSKGWLVVDSNEKWLSLDREGLPISIHEISKRLDKKKNIKWKIDPSGEVFYSPMIYTIGLYSRHGKFYPPYIFFPDINFTEILMNLESHD